MTKIKLVDGQKVEYEVVQGSKGQEARNVTFSERNQAIEHDTEDKMYWCSKGEVIEEAFVKEIVPLLERNIIIHPDKANKKTSIDLFDLDKAKEADLKTQNTPFFSAGQYGCNPQYTVTFNNKDYKYYSKNYPEANIFFWVNWTQINWKTFSVEPMYGVWEVAFSQMASSIESNEVYLHEYHNRIGDKVNATESYLFDLNNFTRIL